MKWRKSRGRKNQLEAATVTLVRGDGVVNYGNDNGRELKVSVFRWFRK